jgi:hypothetical protein
LNSGSRDEADFKLLSEAKEKTKKKEAIIR